ncbi:sex peptide receptor-like [Gigantopelta aegis]|uniref:sex peptide receptor-like n=1 Tax=Gigantopelta aegis TaxID=1735272 RepID=UPI001B887B45|nr:sex peptide receptor-like [Gigantopelta aegis]
MNNITETAQQVISSDGMAQVLTTLIPLLGTQAANTTVAMTTGRVRPSVPPEYLLQVIFVCDQVLTPLVVCFGIIGNIFSIVVLTRKEMSSPTNCFLKALAASDVMLLVVQIPHFLSYNHRLNDTHSFKIFYRYYTIFRYFANNTFITCTCWITVAVTIERFISLRFMMNSRMVCTIRRARRAILAIFLMSFVFHFSKFFEYEPNLNLRQPFPVVGTALVHSTAYETYVHIANITLAAIIPVFVLIVVNSFLIFFLTTHRRRMLKHKTPGSGSTSQVDMMHISFIVVSMVLVFIICHSVGVFLALNIAVHGRYKIFANPLFVSMKHVNGLLVFVNSSINFLLYCAISRKFRTTFASIFLGRLSKKMSWPLQTSTNEQSMLSKANVTTLYTSQISTTSSKGVDDL